MRPSPVLNSSRAVVEGPSNPTARPELRSASSIEEDPFSMATDNSPLNNPKGGGAGTADLKTSGFSQMDDHVDPEEYARLLDLYDNSFRNIAEGEVVKGTVLKVTPSEVIVDVGYKSEGIIPVDEFIDETGQISVQPGDTVDVLLERTEDREGYVVLSREKAEKMKIWDEVEK